MARRFLQPLGKWFSCEAKTMVINNGITSMLPDEEAQVDPDLWQFPSEDSPIYIFARMDYNGLTPEPTTSQSAWDEWIPLDDLMSEMVATLGVNKGFTTINDIPEGMLFYITDNDSGDGPSEYEDYSALITFSDR